MNDTLAELDAILKERKKDDAPKNSYVSSLYHAGLETMLRKISEEATETLLAAKECEHDSTALSHLVEEVADLWFHSLVTLSHLGGDSRLVLDVLKRRMHHQNTQNTKHKREE